MNTQFSIPTAPPAAADGTWQFDYGQCVDHIEGERQGIVIERTRSAKGRELYTLWSIYDDDGRIKHVVGEVLQPVDLGGKTCQGCPYWRGGECCA